MRGFSGVVNLLCSSPGTALHLLCSDARFANESFNLTGSSEPVESFETIWNASPVSTNPQIHKLFTFLRAQHSLCLINQYTNI